MAELFEALVNMTITGSVVIAVIILVRFLLKGMPKKYSYILWAVAGFRLCCPFSFKSIVSIFNINPIQTPSEIVTNSGTMNYIGTPTAIRPDVGQGIPVDAIGGADGPTQVYVTSGIFDIFIDFIPWIWLGGFVALLIYALFSFIKLNKSLATATKYDENIYQSDAISSPFILGIIKPKIYIPYGVESEYLEYVIAHERYHLKRFDNIIKVFAFLVLALHWFNPLCWVAFVLMNKDMEMSCDEWVLSHNDNIKKQYSSALLSFATNRHFPSPSPLCFGENSAKSRIKNVLKFKKPTVIISVLAIILCIVIAVVCIANPKSDNENVENNVDTINISTKAMVQELNNDIMDIIEVSKYLSRATYIDEIIPQAITGVEYVGDSGSGLYCYDFKYKDISFTIPSTSRDISGLMGIFYTVDGQEYASCDKKGNLVFNAGFTDKKQEGNSELFMNIADENYGFIYDKYWYGINKDTDSIIVYCITHDYYGLTATTVYTRDKNGKWSTENETGYYSFDENDTINYYNSDNDYGRAWWHINTEKNYIEELDKSTLKAIQTLIPKEENNLETAKEIYEKYN